jgi:hypothetical protein
MRILLIVAWLFAGLAGVIYHFGPGQDRLESDRLNRMLQEARRSVDQQHWDLAVEQFDAILGDLPADKSTEARQLTLEKAKAQMMAAQLPEARESLESLLDDLRDDEQAEPEFVAEVQSTLANSQYYMTWLMRLEGLPEEEWMPEIEAARQHYTQLARDAERRGNSDLARRSAEDLESSIRLARMDLGELQALPLPSQ